MGILDWLKGGHSAKGEGGIKLMNPGHSLANVRIVGAHMDTLEVPAFQDRVVRVRSGKYSVRFELEDEIEIYQVDGVTVVPGMSTPITLSRKAKQGERVRMVSGPV